MKDNTNIDDLMKRMKEKQAQFQVELDKKRKERWDNLKKFEHPKDIPEIPIVNKNEYNEYYIPKLIAAGAIPKDQLIDKQVYIGKHRRCYVAKWNKEKNVFEYRRNKFGHIYTDTCYHFQDDDGFALFVPIKLGTEEEFEKNQNK